MKLIILLAACFIATNSYAQTIKEYKASNGVTYHLNDTVRLGRGSNNNGSFTYVEDRGLFAVNLPGPSGGRGNNGRALPKEFANGGVIIKSIKKTKENNVDKYVFMVFAGGPIRFTLTIDDAISACEVVPCAQSTGKPVPSVADELKKLKELLDAGGLTKEEYEAQKKKLLNQ